METKHKKQGAASFYMVIVCALLFGVIAAGFITLMVSEMSKSSENNLSQSAYDSAIVGIEDMKILIKQYNEAMAKEAREQTDKEKQIIKMINDYTTSEAKKGDCINFNDYELGFAKTGDGDIYVQEKADGSGQTTTQAYTCISLDPFPKDYLATLSSESPLRLIPLQAKDGNASIQSVKISWYSSDNLAGQSTNFINDINTTTKNINFGPDNNGNEASNPPVLVASVYQTGANINLDDFASSNISNQTNRGTLWLVPSSANDNPKYTDVALSNYYSSWGSYGTGNSTTEKGRTTIINSKALVDSNNHNPGITHDGFPVRCASNDDINNNSQLSYLCSVEIILPSPINSISRSDERGTFLLALALPYGQPMTDIRVEMADSNSWDAAHGSYIAKEFDKVQIVVDSTGRANDVFQRVESRVESFNSDFPFPDYALTLGGDGGEALFKNFITASSAYDGCWYTSTSGGNYNDPTDCSV